ncbi:hypothetical protein [Aurantibacillus circumpalustris]|uniref:hypothetical protein n=1 Tax=Aurantibacillus circumpalustris TaxID=3036359 RepID=UPI00295AF8C7|nr:hypothetical protein [Aurantibacillus circumpalustris]
MEDNEHIHKHLKDSMNEFLVQPKLNSFDAIIEKLEKKRRRIFLIFFYPGALLFTLGTLFFLNDFDISKTSLLTQKNTDNEIKNGPLSKNLNAKSLIKNKPESNLKPTPTISNKKIAKAPTQSVLLENKNTSSEKSSSISQKDQEVVSASEVNNKLIHEVAKETSQENLSQVILDEKTFVEADKLQAMSAYLPAIERPLIIQDKLVEDNFVVTNNDTLKKKKHLKILIGLAFNPQLGTYHFQTNKNSAIGELYSEAYLNNKKKQNSFKFNYAWGLKAGVLIKDKWEILLGFGLQRYNQEEKIEPLLPTGPVPTVSGPKQFDSFNLYSAAAVKTGETYLNKYNYLDFSLEASKIFDYKSILKIKLGTGFHLQHLAFRKSSSMIIIDSPSQFYYTNGFNSSINNWQYTINLKAGVIEDLTKKIQVQLCPNFFYSPSSMFNDEYAIKQKSYGFGLEASLLFKIR